MFTLSKIQKIFITSAKKPIKIRINQHVEFELNTNTRSRFFERKNHNIKTCIATMNKSKEVNQYKNGSENNRNTRIVESDGFMGGREREKGRNLPAKMQGLEKE